MAKNEQVGRMGEAPFEGPERLARDTLLQLKQNFGKISFDRLRTLVLVYRTGSARRAADELDRDQASVQTQLNTLNGYFQEMCGQALVQKGRKKGDDFVFTQTGELVVHWAEDLLATWLDRIDQERARIGERITVATTAFTLPILGSLWSTFLANLESHVEPSFIQIRTSEFQVALSKRRIDLALAGVACVDDVPSVPSGYSFEKWGYDDLRVLTNLPQNIVPGNRLTLADISRHSLILPAAGLIRELADTIAMYERIELRPECTISDVYYGLNILRYGLLKGCMLVAGNVGQWALDHSPTWAHKPPTESLRLLTILPSKRTFRIVSGLFGRECDRTQLAKNHPVNIFWSMFTIATERRNSL